MAVHMSLGGNAVGDGFLIAPLGSNYDAEIALWTDSGTASVTLQALPNPANLVFSTVGPFSITTVPTVYATVQSRLQSKSRGDTTIQVLEGITVVASFNVTSIKHPVVNFNGRFEARFATDGDRPYINPIYTDTATHTANDDPVPLSQGRTFGLEGEPNFVPITGTVPTNLDMTGVGRNVRLNNAVALRSPALPVVSTVVSISGDTATTTGETFLAGDPLIGQFVNFGPDTYLAGNDDSTDTAGPAPTPEEFWGAGQEPMALLQINIGTPPFTPPTIYFQGASQVGPFVAKSPAVNTPTRTPDSRPFAHGIGTPPASAYATFGIPTDLKTFAKNRLAALLVDYAGLPPGTSLQRRNLVRRIDHILACLQFCFNSPFVGPPDGPDATLGPVISNAQAQAVAPDVFTTDRANSDPVDWENTEHYVGKVDTALHAWPGGSPGASSVVAYLTQFFSFDFVWDPFAFNTDENCGYHTGSLSGDLTRTGNHIGDPHVHTVDGTAYDFQSVGEFTLLRDGDRMEVQVRQWPVPTANPVTDAHSGLTECVSINTAVAVRIGAHQIALQQGPERQQLEFYVDGKPAEIGGPLDQEVGAVVALLPDGTQYRQVLLNPVEGQTHVTPDGRSWLAVHEEVADGVVVVTPFTIHWKGRASGEDEAIELGGSRVTVFAASGANGIRVDFEDGTVVLITPNFWSANSVWYLDVSVSNTSADEGVMGFIPKGSWLPRLRNGVNVGPIPASLHDRYVTLYKTFADSWRVTDKTSLFVYAPGTSTSTFTDPDWPAEMLPCNLKPQFQIPGVNVHEGMPVDRAEVICRIVTDKNLNQNCVFDVATTGDEIFAKGYAFAEEIGLHSTFVKIECYQGPSHPYRSPNATADAPAQEEVRSVTVTATVAPLTPGRPIPTGTVTVYIDGVPMNQPTLLDGRGQARVKITGVKPGEHKIRATYSGGGKFDYHSSSSSTLVVEIPPPAGPKCGFGRNPGGIDQVVGEIVFMLPDGTEYRQVLGTATEDQRYQTADGCNWIAVREEVVGGEIVKNPFTIHWKLASSPS